MENQLLLSDLSVSTSPESPPLRNLIPSQEDFAHHPKVIHLPNRGILVQIQSITEIGHSALSLQTVHQKIQDDAEGRDRVLDLEDPESQHRQAPIVYPRAMLRFDLGDGHHTVPAIEYQRMEGLSLMETPLGCKLLIKAVSVRRGLLLLTPENTVIKGYRVDELDSNRNQVFRDGLNVRLGQPSVLPAANNEPPLDETGRDTIDSSTVSGTSASIINTHNLSSVNQPTLIEISDSDDYFDDNSEFEAELLAHDI